MSAAAPLVAPEHTAAAFAYLQRLPQCPTTLQEAEQSPAWGGALHGIAVNMARRALREHWQRRYSVRNASAIRTGPQHPPQHPNRFDAKKAAANDRD